MNERLFTTLVRLVILVAVIPAHECAHAVVAGRLGDDTAKNLGRNTLNPLKHLDPVGSLLLLLTGFGWAKPVPISGRGFRNFKRDMAVNSLAGPAANVVLAFVFAVLYKLSLGVVSYSFLGLYFVDTVIWITLSLAVFNMIPIPPLDGSRLLTALLPDRAYYTVMKYERVIMGVLMACLFLGILSLPIQRATLFLYDLVDRATFFLGYFPLGMHFSL